MFSGCSGVRVSVENKSALSVSNISLAFTGGQVEIPLLLPAATKVVGVHPSQASSIQMSYWMNGSMINTNLDLYIEPLHRGELVITIQSDRPVVTVNNPHGWRAKPEKRMERSLLNTSNKDSRPYSR